MDSFKDFSKKLSIIKDEKINDCIFIFQHQKIIIKNYDYKLTHTEWFSSTNKRSRELNNEYDNEDDYIYKKIKKS
jgi:hypothetical protein